MITIITAYLDLDYSSYSTFICEIFRKLHSTHSTHTHPILDLAHTHNIETKLTGLDYRVTRVGPHLHYYLRPFGLLDRAGKHPGTAGPLSYLTS